jgi:cytochrome c oxidase assembly protein subunit 15
LIITTGGWIRINDAGESCPDWPTCFGTWGFDVSADDQEKWWEENPDEIDSRGGTHRYTSYQIFTEWSHRALVAVIGILVAYSHYTAWSLRDKIGNRVYRIHFVSSMFLILQAVLGYVTVDLDNAPWTVSLHLFMALIFTISLITVGLIWWKEQSGLPESFRTLEISKRLKKYVWYLTLIVLLQLMIGAYLSTSYHRAACDIGFYKGWPLCQNSLLPALKQFGIMLNYGHRLSAVVVGGLLLYVEREANKEFKEPKNIVRLMLKIAGIFYFVNIILGGLYVITAVEGVFLGWISLIHLLVGACVFLTLASTYVIAHLVTTERQNVAS